MLRPSRVGDVSIDLVHDLAFCSEFPVDRIACACAHSFSDVVQHWDRHLVDDDPPLPLHRNIDPPTGRRQRHRVTDGKRGWDLDASKVEALHGSLVIHHANVTTWGDEVEGLFESTNAHLAACVNIT